MSPPAKAASTFAKFFPVEVYPVAAVVGAAGGLFTFMLTRTILADPDTKHDVNMPIDCHKTAAYGEVWRKSIKSLFDQRIQAGATSIFKNEVAMQRM
eukprot:gene13014-13143_t